VIWRRLALAMTVLALLAAALWLARARLAADLAGAYFRQHGIAASVEIDALGLTGASGRFRLGPAEAPELSADRVEVDFDPLSLMPRIVQVRLAKPLVRARMDAAGTVTLPSLQAWIGSLSEGQGQSRYVSPDLIVSLKGLRVFLATPYGALETDGDVRLVKSLPVSASLSLRPTTLVTGKARLTLRAAKLEFDQAKAEFKAHLSGDLATDMAALDGIDADLGVADFHWSKTGGGLRLNAVAARLFAGAATLQVAGQGLAAPRLDLIAHKADLSFGGGKLEGAADLDAGASGAFDPGAMALLKARDPALARAVTRNLARLELALSAHVERHGDDMRLSLRAPLTLRGADGALLKMENVSLQQSGAGWRGAMRTSLAGGGMPNLGLTSRGFTFANGALNGDLALKADFDFAMLRGADLTVAGQFSWQDGHYAFNATSCGHLSLTAFHPGASDLARAVAADLCGDAGGPLLAGQGAAWRFNGAARGAEALLPAANAKLSDGAGILSFAGQGGDFSGAVNSAQGRVTDQSAPIRFKPVLARGAVALAKNVWSGRLALSDTKRDALGEVTLRHDMESGAGTAHLSAPHLSFAAGKLQPEDLSPLLAAFRRAQGATGFEGDIDWNQGAITSRGKLNVDSLEFLTPLGRAHAMKTALDFTSLLPPMTAPGQKLAIDRIDATLPVSGLALVFAFDPKAVAVQALSGDLALGHVALNAFTVDFSDPTRIKGAAKLSSISLASLVTASNLGSKVKIEGTVSGSVPFSSSAAGFRILGGHVAADGPGRLSVDRSLWTEGGAANAVQDFAYQAMENLAFDQLSADLNSLDNGRLQVVFHIKGHSDPPKKQTAEIPVTDLINGTALQKPLPLPSGTPVDLTLDTSLNFDELLKSYAQAWSNILGPKADAGASP
jgi:hypothetical protein